MIADLLRLASVEADRRHGEVVAAAIRHYESVCSYQQWLADYVYLKIAMTRAKRAYLHAERWDGPMSLQMASFSSEAKKIRGRLYSNPCRSCDKCRNRFGNSLK